MHLFLKFLAFRLINALFIVKYQYFEESLYGPEIGYNQIYDYGKLSTEQTVYKEQSLSLFSNMYFIFYGILKHSGMDCYYFTAYGPRIIQCFFTAISDCYLIKIGKIWGVERFPLILINLCTWFSCQCAVMSLKNSLIQSLYLLALYYWVLYQYKKSKYNSIISRCIIIIIGTISFITIIPWIIEWIQELRNKKKMSLLLLNVYSILGLILFIFINDNFDYHSIFIKLLHFIVQIEININLIEMILLLPYVVLGWIVFFIVGLYAQYRLKNRSILHIMIYYLISILLLKNVQELDILPIFQLIIVICALGMQQMKKHKFNNILVFIGVFSNINMFLLHNIYQNQDGITAIQQISSNNNINGVLFLTNCHQTPYYTFIQQNITINYPICDQEIDDSFYFVQNRIEQYQSNLIVLHNIYVNHDVDEYLKENNYYYVILNQYYQGHFYKIGQFEK